MWYRGVQVRRTAVSSARLALFGAVLLIASACSMPDNTIESTMPAELDEEVVAVSLVVESMSELSSVESEDLAMAWTDLNSDLISITRDAARNPESVDLEGMLVRIESFHDRFGSQEPMQRLGDQWDQLMETLTTVAEQVNSRSRQVARSSE
jgi:hypothetical protein